MTSDRMRRVNEAMREVLSGAITSELKDPRVGFVTVTAVETSPDLRHARVFVSVLGNPGERRRTLQALDSAHGFLQRRVGAELRMKNTPQLQFVYDDTPERGMRINELLDQTRTRPDGRLQRRAVVARGGAAGDPRARALLPHHARAARRRRGRLAGRRCSRCWPRSARTRSRSCPPTSSRSRTSTASSSSRAWPPSRPPTSPSATLIFLDCGNIDRTPLEQLRARRRHALIVNIDHHHDNTRFGTINHVDPHASCTAEMVWDLMHGLGVPITQAIGRGALRRPGDRHRAASCTRTPGRARTRWRPS